MIKSIKNNYTRRALAIVWLIAYSIVVIIDVIIETAVYLLDCLGFSGFEGSISEIKSEFVVKFASIKSGAVDLWRGE